MEHTIFFFVTLALAIAAIAWIMWYFGVHKDYSGNKLPDNVKPRKEKNYE